MSICTLLPPFARPWSQSLFHPLPRVSGLQEASADAASSPSGSRSRSPLPSLTVFTASALALPEGHLPRLQLAAKISLSAAKCLLYPPWENTGEVRGNSKRQPRASNVNDSSHLSCAAVPVLAPAAWQPDTAASRCRTRWERERVARARRQSTRGRTQREATEVSRTLLRPSPAARAALASAPKTRAKLDA